MKTTFFVKKLDSSRGSSTLNAAILSRATDQFSGGMLMRRQYLRILWCCALALAASPAFAQFLPGGGHNTPDPTLPPSPSPPAKYLTPDDVHATYTGANLQIVLSAIQHLPFKDQPPGYHSGSNGTPDE